MTILEVRKDDNRQLQNIANTLVAAKKIVVVTGAGISTNCGIPDFRSEQGLYSLIQAQRDAVETSKPTRDPAERQPLTPRRHIEPTPAKRSAKQTSIPNNIKGKDLFDAQLWKDPTSTSVFYKFIASLRRTIREDVKRATSTHRFIRTLRDRRKLVRCYTQNIDGLEAREDLCTDMERGKGNRARFTKQSMEKPKSPVRSGPEGSLDGGCEVVQLHGDLDVLRCTLCQQTSPWDEHGRETRLLTGKAPTCQSCIATNLDRQDRGKRGTKIGTLRPNIVLYGEEHPSADAVGTITAHDLALSPDLLLVLGTSLHVHGLKVLVKEFAKSVHARAGGKGKVIFVNLSRPTESVWKDVFDYWVDMDCDEWVGAMRKHRHDLFQVQDELKFGISKRIGKTKKTIVSSPPLSAMDDDKENVEVNPASTPRKNMTHPKVLVTPKKTLPLQAKASNKGSDFLDQLQAAARASRKPNEQTQLDDQLQLPTPPGTGHRAKLQTPSKKRSLVETYQDMFDTPSKRKKTALTVWEDEDVAV